MERGRLRPSVTIAHGDDTPQNLAAQLVTTCNEQQLLLLEGLDDSAAETSRPIRSLLLYALPQVQSQTLLGWRSALCVLATLEDVFQAISDEARHLEQTGVISPLNGVPQQFDVAMA